MTDEKDVKIRYATSTSGQVRHIRDADGSALCGRAKLLAHDIEDEDDLDICYYCIVRYQEADQELDQMLADGTVLLLQLANDDGAVERIANTLDRAGQPPMDHDAIRRALRAAAAGSAIPPVSTGGSDD